MKITYKYKVFPFELIICLDTMSILSFFFLLFNILSSIEGLWVWWCRKDNQTPTKVNLTMLHDVYIYIYRSILTACKHYLLLRSMIFFLLLFYIRWTDTTSAYHFLFLDIRVAILFTRKLFFIDLVDGSHHHYNRKTMIFSSLLFSFTYIDLLSK